jgi:dipeptidyl aminopeptidase/acylaminoacyl peptidase
MRPLVIAPLWALLLFIVNPANPQTFAGPSVREIVEFKRIVQPVDQDENALREQVSPDGKQAFVVTRQADVDSDKNRYDILLLNVAPDRLGTQRVPNPATIFSVAVDNDNSGVFSAIRNVQWHGDRRLVFMARLSGHSFQVFSLDIRTRKLAQLTHERNLIVSYAVSQDLQRVVYAIQVPNPPLKDGAHSVVVGSQSFWDVKFGQHDLVAQDHVYRYFVSDVASPRPPRALGEAFADQNSVWPTVSVSPDGRWAVLPHWEPERLAEWERDYPMVAELSRKYAHSQHIDPLGYFSKPTSYVPRRMMAWRLDDGEEQAILDAPDDAVPGSWQLRSDRFWQGSGESVVLTGTHLPLKPGNQESREAHIIEYWPDSKRWAVIAKLHNHAMEAYALPDGFLVMDGEVRREFHRQADGGWREGSSNSPAPAWHLRIDQSLNQPPDVYAVGPTGESTRLTALTPQFNEATWGTVQPYTWRDASGAQWNGGLISASKMVPNTRYPLVIQTYGFDANRFYLAGPNWGDGATSAFAGRAFLREGILVLAMPIAPKSELPKTLRETEQAFNGGVRGAIEALVKEGRVDPSRIGIIGWSATGQRVLNLITFGDVPIRAATMADSDANTMFSLAVTYGGASETMWDKKATTNGGMPFGAGLAEWIRNDPSMHTDCIHAALRIESYGPWVANNWDLNALLRRQYKPLEMVVIPGGTHSLGTPSDRMVSLQGNVDWYGFWLAGSTRTEPVLASETIDSLAAQYARWRQMETLKAADDALPPCAR